MYMHHIRAWCLWRPEATSGPLELELWVVVSWFVVTRNKTQVIWKSNDCALQPLTYVLYGVFKPDAHSLSTYCATKFYCWQFGRRQRKA